MADSSEDTGFLPQQREGEIEPHAHSWKLLQQVGHIIVCFGRMKADPGHVGRFCHWIDIVRLMYMLDEADVRVFHGGHGGMVVSMALGGRPMQSTVRFARTRLNVD